MPPATLPQVVSFEPGVESRQYQEWYSAYRPLKRAPKAGVILPVDECASHPAPCNMGLGLECRKIEGITVMVPVVLLQQLQV